MFRRLLWAAADITERLMSAAADIYFRKATGQRAFFSRGLLYKE